MNTRTIVAGLAAGLALAAADEGRATNLSGAPTLGAYVIGSNNLIVGDAFPGGLSAPGSKSVAAGSPFGSGTISLAVSPDPSVEVTFAPTSPFNGIASMNLSYQIEYYDPSAGVVQDPTSANYTPITVELFTSDIFQVDSKDDGAATLTIQGAAALSGAFEEAQCVSLVHACGGETDTPFSDEAISLWENEAYTVTLSVSGYGPDALTVAIDPHFAAPPGAGGVFIGSPGVVVSAPEPASWMLALAGAGLAGAALRRRRFIADRRSAVHGR